MRTRSPALGLTLVAALAAGCSTTGGSSGGHEHLPVSGAGPFKPLPPSDDPAVTITAPYVASQPGVDLDEPFVLARGAQLALWVTVTRPGGDTHIEHADALTLGTGFGLWQTALTADQPWEPGVVQSPSVIEDSPWVLFYAAGGAIGWATGPDGHAWHKAPGPALRAEGPEAAADAALSSPSAVRLGDRVRVYYLGSGRVWAAEAPWADVAAGRAAAWSRVDGDPTTPVRDPILEPASLQLVGSSGAPLATGALGRLTARADTTAAGRVRHDLYLTVAVPVAGMPPGSTCAFATSFTGDRFVVSPAPLLPLAEAARAPAETRYLAPDVPPGVDGAVLLYVKALGGRGAIAAATSP